MSELDLKATLHDRGMKLATIATDLKVNKATVTRWCQNKIPAERVADFSRVTGIPREELRPDIFEVAQ